jgi:GT2 family glycosyltransferase
MMVKASLFKEQLGFDESFFAHMEEIDLCWRLKNAGYSIHFVGNSSVYHLGGGTLSSISPNKTYLNFRNNLFLLYKNLPDGFLYRTLFARMVLDGVAFIQFLLSTKFSHAGAILKAHFSFYKRLKYLKQNRDKYKNYHQLKYLKGVYNASIVYTFYIKSIKVFNQLLPIKFGQ